MEVDKIGVHTTHCCKKCGCKYGDPNCPVELGVIEAEILCEWCEEWKEEIRNSFFRLDLPELEGMVLHLEKLIQERRSVVGR